MYVTSVDFLQTQFKKTKNPRSIIDNAESVMEQLNVNLNPVKVFTEKMLNMDIPDHTKTCLFKYILNFTTKNCKFSDKYSDIFSDKYSDIFHISAQNIDCGYSLEPPRRGGSNEYPQSTFLSRNKKISVYSCLFWFW